MLRLDTQRKDRAPTATPARLVRGPDSGLRRRRRDHHVWQRSRSSRSRSSPASRRCSSRKIVEAARMNSALVVRHLFCGITSADPRGRSTSVLSSLSVVSKLRLLRAGSRSSATRPQRITTSTSASSPSLKSFDASRLRSRLGDFAHDGPGHPRASRSSSSARSSGSRRSIEHPRAAGTRPAASSSSPASARPAGSASTCSGSLVFSVMNVPSLLDGPDLVQGRQRRSRSRASSSRPVRRSEVPGCGRRRPLLVEHPDSLIVVGAVVRRLGRARVPRCSLWRIPLLRRPASS